MASADPFVRLSDRQRECLRLVYAHRRQKEIARDLGISPATVEMHLKAARAALGAGDSREAARMLADWEAGTTYGESIHGPRTIADPLADLPPFSLQAHFGTERFEGSSDRAVREDQAFFDAFAETQSYFPTPPLPTLGRPRNDLGIWLRLAWIGTIVVGLLLGTAMMVGAFASLTPVIEALKN